MVDKRKILLNLHKEHIRDTEPKAIIADKTTCLCHLTIAVIRGLNLKVGKVCVTTRCLKHLYDKKPAEQYDFLLNNLHRIVKYPDLIYKNKDQKRGDFCFRKKLNKEEYLCSLEVTEKELYIATAFRVNKLDYLNGYELLWNWRGGNPSS